MMNKDMPNCRRGDYQSPAEKPKNRPNEIITGARVLIETLISEGVDTVFGYPGGAVLHIYDELYKNAGRINHVLSAHEQGAAHAADGYARVSGKTGVVIATSGPGATNLVTGIANAYLDSVPMVAVTGNVTESMLGKDSFQEVDIVGITQPVVKHSYIVRDAAKLERTLREAFLIANTGRKGPVLVDVPKSVQQAECGYSGRPAALRTCQIKYDNDFDGAINAINNCARPYIYCGGGVLASDAGDVIMALSEKISAPIGLSMMGMTAVPHSCELNLGMCGMHGRYAATVAQSEADLVIAAGVRFSDRATGDPDKYSQSCKIIHIDIDAAEIGKNVRSQIGLRGDVREVLDQILPRIEAVPRGVWLSRVKEIKKEGKKAFNREPTGEFTPAGIIKTVRRHCGDGTVIATDVGQHQMWVMQHYPFEKPRTLLTSGGLGAMGYGLGAAVGGCLASGKRRTVLFTSDGSFGMNLTELATAVSQELPVSIVILNNGALGMVRQWQSLFFGGRHSQTTLRRETDFPALARAFGAGGFAASSLGELESILDNNLSPDRPTVIDCRIDIDEKVYPMVPPGGSAGDIIIGSSEQKWEQ